MRVSRQSFRSPWWTRVAQLCVSFDATNVFIPILTRTSQILSIRHVSRSRSSIINFLQIPPIFGENYYYESMINLYTHILSYIHYDCINNFSFFFVKIEDIIKRRWVGLKRLLGSRQKKKLAGILNAKSAPTLDLGNFPSHAENILNTHTSGNKTPSYTLLSSFLLLKSSLLMFIWSYYEGFARKKIRLCRLSRKIHVISRCIGEDRATCPSSLRLLSFGACSREEAQVSNPLRINQVFVELLKNLSSFSDILLSW